MSKTDYLENVVLNWIKGTPTTPPSTLYVALFSTATTDGGGGTELSGSGYARQVITFGSISGGQILNSNQVSFPVNSGPGSWAQATHWAIFDASSGGNMLRHAPLAVAKTIAVGEQATFPIGSLLLSED